MPPRIHILSSDSLTFMYIYAASVTGWLSDKDWERIVGPFGGFVVTLLMLGIFVRHSAKRLKREDERSKADAEAWEQRHKEQMAAQDKLAAMLDLQASNYANLAIRSAVAVESVDRTMQRLTSEWEKKPCHPFGQTKKAS